MKNKFKNKKFIKEKIPMYYYILKNKETPKLAKTIIALLGIYIISPLDIIPDTIPLLGLADDIAFIPLVSMLISKIIPDEIWRESEVFTERIWFNSKKYRLIKIIAFSIIVIIAIILIKNLFYTK